MGFLPLSRRATYILLIGLLLVVAKAHAAEPSEDFKQRLLSKWHQLRSHAIHYNVEDFKDIWTPLSEADQIALLEYVDPVIAGPNGPTGKDNLLHYAADLYGPSLKDKVVTSEMIDLLCPAAQKTMNALNTINVQSFLPIDFAVGKGYYPVAKALIECGAKTDIAANSFIKLNAQMVIVATGRIDLFELIKDSIDITAADFLGRTLLRHAIGGQQIAKTDDPLVNHNDIINQLQQLGVPLNKDGCEYFNATKSTTSSPSGYQYVTYTDKNNARSIWRKYRAKHSDKENMGRALISGHDYVNTQEELLSQAEQEAINKCAGAGYKTCLATPTLDLPPKWLSAENPLSVAILKSKREKIGGNKSMLIYRKLSVAVSVVGLENNAEASACKERALSLIAK